MGSSDRVRRNSAEQEAYFVQNRYLMEMNDARRVSMTGSAARCSEAEVPTSRRPQGVRNDCREQGWQR